MKEIESSVELKKKKGNYNKSAILARKMLTLITEKNYSFGKAMEEVGYSKSYSKNPHQVTDNKSWQDTVDEMLPNTDLLKKHKQLLEAKKPIYLKGEIVDEEGLEDYVTQVRALDMAYKLKGSYAPERFTMIDPLDDLTIEQLENELEKLDKELSRYEEADGSTNFRKTKKGTPKGKGKKISK